MTPVDLIQASVYQSLEGRFREAEKRSATARSSLGFLKAFTWVPGIGSQIKEAHLLLEMGYYQGRGGGNLAEAYRAAISLPLEDLPPDVVAEQIARTLQGSLPQLDQAQQDLRRVAELGEHLEDTERGARYSALVKRYLPALQTVVYLSRTSPSVIGHTYALSRELSSLQELAVDPLDVMENPEGVGRVLANITDQASALEQSLNVVRQATKASDERDTPELTKVIEVLDSLVPGISLLKHVTAGTRSLVTMAESIESEGFLSQEFGAVVGVALDDARQELALAREEVSSLQELLSVQGIDAETFLPSIVFGGDSDVPLSTTQRVEVMLDDAISGADFLYSLLGYDGKRTYLLVGQNPNEIRATGGFIGIAVEVKVDKGELIDLVYHDSVLVDQEPLTDNPRPPEGLFWYLWMGRLLFRDSNWNPHFPSSAAKVAEIFTLGQGVQVDGVITATKRLAIDLVTLFGDIKVPGLKDVLTKKTATLYTETENLYECQPRHISIRPKRCFDEDLSRSAPTRTVFALQDRLTRGVPSSVRRGLVQLVNDELDQNNVLIHVFHPLDDSFLWERGWNGAMPLVDHDYLFVVDSSLPGHSNAGTRRSLEYKVSLNPNQPVDAQLRLRYSNEGAAKDEICRQYDWHLYRCYWNYFRVYVPPMATEIQMPPIPLHEGSLKLVWGYPDIDSASVIANADTGPARLTELGGYIAVEPGSTTTVPIQYRLPWEIIRSTGPDIYEYRLLVQKQPGMDRDRVSLTVQLAPNMQLVSTSPEYTSIRGQSLIFDFVLQSDTIVVVSFRKNGRG